jgi:tetratricopeptide (TPR) repeat protein
MLFVVSLLLTQPSPEAQRRVDEATAAEQRAVRLSPRDPVAYAALAEGFKKHKFLRAAGEAMRSAVSLDPTNSAHYLSLAPLLMRSGDPEGGKASMDFALSLDRSAEALFQLSLMHQRDFPKVESAVREALSLDPTHVQAHVRLNWLLQQQGRSAEAEVTLRSLAQIDPRVGGSKLYDLLRYDDGGRKVEAAIAHHGAQRLLREREQEKASSRAAHGKAANLFSSDYSPQLADWAQFVRGLSSRSLPAKCLARECIEGLSAAIEDADGKPKADELTPPFDETTIVDLLRGGKRRESDPSGGDQSGRPPVVRPTVLRGATLDWEPTHKWDTRYMQDVAGDEELEVTVVEEDGAFEVRHDRIERPPKSHMRLADFAQLLSLKVDANLTIYSRQAPLWPMTGLLLDLKPLSWMEPLRLSDLNFWLGDGHFRNTLHFDPFDNLLCQVRGSKHLLFWPPEQKRNLYYGARKDIQARYEPSRGEYGRHDTGIVSENTASINGASPDPEAFPLFRHARKAQSYTQIDAGDCLFLPRNWHHHVFSEADGATGYNLAINLWVDRDTTISGAELFHKAKPHAPVYPTLRQVQEALQAVADGVGGAAADQPAEQAQGGMKGEEGSCSSDASGQAG